MAVPSDLTHILKMVTQNTGDIKQHRTQLSQVYTKLKKMEGGDVPRSRQTSEEIGPNLIGQLEFINGQVAKVQGDHQQQQRLLEELTQRVAASEGMARQRALTTDSVESSQNNIKQELQQHSVQLDELKRQRAQAELQREMQQMQREMQHMQQVAEQMKQDPKIFGLEHELQQSKLYVGNLERKLLDAGVLCRKPPGPERTPAQIEKSPPIGTLNLGEDMFSARLLLKLGYQKVDMEKTSEGFAETFDETFDSDTDSDHECNWLHIVSGISNPPIPKSVGSYKVLTRGTYFLCLMVVFIEFLAISEVIAFGIRNGNVCVHDDMTPFSRFDLHMSKFLGVVVVGFLMGKRMMDNVSYAMIGMLLHSSDLEHKIFAFLNFLSLILGGFANGVLFAISTSPDGVWLKTSAMSVLINLRGACALVAKSGILGPTLGRSMNSVSYKLSFYAEYPPWFGSMRNMTIIATCSFILLFAGTLFVVPLPVCPADGSQPPNIFTDIPGSIRRALQHGSW